MKARKPKAQRERVVVAWGVADGNGELWYTDHIRSRARDVAREGSHRIGPHRVVRLEGRVKV